VKDIVMRSISFSLSTFLDLFTAKIAGYTFILTTYDTET